MKPNKLTLLSTAALAVGAALLLAPNALAADAKTSLNAADARFVQKEAAAGVALVKVAELGTKKSERADIKAFAGMLVADHTKANTELMTLARSKGVELTSEVDPKHVETHAMLESKSGADFDKEFLAVIVKGHQKCVTSFEKAADDAEDTDLKAWATKMLPGLNAHLEKAEELGSVSTAKTDAGNTTTTTPIGASPRTPNSEPDNTVRNKRDRDAKSLTPLDQGNSKADTDTTAQIRKEILKLEDLSVNGQNVKIITNEGRVTLRGPVNSANEKRLIGEIAARIVTSEHADNQLEVRGAEAAN